MLYQEHMFSLYAGIEPSRNVFQQSLLWQKWFQRKERAGGRIRVSSLWDYTCIHCLMLY